MGLELSRDEIINNFFMIEGSDNLEEVSNSNKVIELFNSDLLIIPFYKMGNGFICSEELCMKDEYNDKRLKINIYSGNDRIYWQLLRPYTDIIYLGAVIIQTVAGLIAIKEYLNKKYSASKESNKDYITIINIQLYIKNENNNYNCFIFKGKISDFNEQINNTLLKSRGKK